MVAAYLACKAASYARINIDRSLKDIWDGCPGGRDYRFSYNRPAQQGSITGADMLGEVAEHVCDLRWPDHRAPGKRGRDSE